MKPPSSRPVGRPREPNAVRNCVLAELASGPRTGPELGKACCNRRGHEMNAAARDALLAELVAAGLVVARPEPTGYRQNLVMTYRLPEPKPETPTEA